ncbi:MAG TPA: ATP-binding protein, partial [Firmicutes bacterium]|nr:ATP-binding protein [Bacillota bacterium]
MKPRPLWIEKIQELWKHRSIVWLSGVRRIGKTFLCKQLQNATYFNCDLPSIQRQCADPEFFLARLDPDNPILLDEIHRIEVPSLLLKIAADEYPALRILATGSSTLQATKKFRDSLTGRKHSINLVPVLWRECASSFGVKDLDRRLLNGGFPEMLLSEAPDASFFEEWIDSFYARDIQELFGVRNRSGFLSLLKLLCLRSGGEIDISDLAKESGMSRPTVISHMDAMEIAHAVVSIPPYHGGGHREIIKRPRVYAFDTGLVSHVRGWERVRDDDRGHLWEHLVLDELRVSYPNRAIHYWRDKSRREIDFAIDRGRNVVDAVE